MRKGMSYTNLQSRGGLAEVRYNPSVIFLSHAELLMVGRSKVCHGTLRRRVRSLS
jgi:hypothetical protein